MLIYPSSSGEEASVFDSRWMESLFSRKLQFTYVIQSHVNNSRDKHELI